MQASPVERKLRKEGAAEQSIAWDRWAACFIVVGAALLAAPAPSLGTKGWARKVAR